MRDSVAELRSRRRVTRAVLLLLLASTIWPSTAEAYIDPGSGSYLLQLILAAVFGALYAVKLCWRRIARAVTRVFRSSDRMTDSDDPARH
jgi:hypothetical protein